ncbi:ATP-dependent DNA ligase [Solicola sp. PLA-1-18]|uniref:ATP-dependent DNA ligase n=1 Tax=Solicola sp. PLA-1-18 TaxID=3380532 RepID=UPI003B824CCD
MPLGLPVPVDLAPMLARAVDTVPAGDYAYEPKWDGYRCLLFRDGDDVVLGSRSGKALTRYFPELVDAVLASALPRRCALDGEIVVPVAGRLDWDRLSDRIHPSAARVRELAAATPASFVAFDLLADGDDSCLDLPFSDRRARLERVLEPVDPPLHLSRVTHDVDVARGWFDTFEGAGLDGVVAKPVGARYSPGRRTMLKVKHQRTADTVLAGYRPHKRSSAARPLLGSMLLGLWDDDGVLQFVGGCAAFADGVRADLAAMLDELRVDAGDHPWTSGERGEDDRRPENEHRWSGAKDQAFVPLDPRVVVEVAYDQLQSRRFRHATQFVRFRPDRDPASCTYDQLDVPAAYDLSDVLQ